MALLCCNNMVTNGAQSMAKILGLGGVFFKSADPEKLAGWYKEYLGLDIDPSFNGVSFPIGEVPDYGYSVWGPFKEDTTYFEPSTKDYMINFIVDDVEALLLQAKNGGAEVHGSANEEPYGYFGWFSDPDGNKVELWRPSKKSD